MIKTRLARRLPAFAGIACALLTAAAAVAAPAPKRGAEAPAPLKFSDIFKMPVGPKGLEVTDATRALDGKRVRLVGYVVEQEGGAPTLLLSPLPLMVGDEDEGLADDVPPTAVAVRSASKQSLPEAKGLVEVVGVLELGARQDAVSGRVSSIHIVAEPKAVKAVRTPRAPAKSAQGAAKAGPSLAVEPQSTH